MGLLTLHHMFTRKHIQLSLAKLKQELRIMMSKISALDLPRPLSNANCTTFEHSEASSLI